MIGIENFIRDHMSCSWRIYNLTGDYESVKHWWAAPNDDLQGKTPLDFFKEGAGHQRKLIEYTLSLYRS